MRQILQTADGEGMQTWITKHGLKFNAAVVNYAGKDVVLQRHRGKPYVNDQRHENLPGIYRKMIPLIVNQLEETGPERPNGLSGLDQEPAVRRQLVVRFSDS